jgi:hypothetical protein
MTPERWERIQVLYHAARTLPESDRAQFLADSCGGDVTLEQEVQELLDQPVSTGSFMDFVGGPVPAQLSGVVATDLTGRQLGSYQLISLLGRGGMGDVYRAHDSRLRRDVAIKVLPVRFTADVERLARFEREARVLAALNHPNIATIHGVEESDVSTSSGQTVRALVMELVDGDTLAERIQRGAVPVSEALAVARQMTDGLEAAHDKGIIHRDLKPANIKITKSGLVKVLDFGLAKASDIVSAGDPSAAPTMTADRTRAGMIVGTAAYMSPEQARGHAVDKRTDIWAFGCVLYEMLSGRAAFARDTITDTLAAIVEREPMWSLLPPSVPRSTARLLRRCLEKDPKRRLRDIGDARLDLEEAISGSAAEDQTAQKTPGVTRRTAIGTLLGATAGAAATGIFAVSRYRNDATRRNLVRFAITLPERHFFNASFNKRVGISPDGAFLACNAVVQGDQPRLLIRSMRDLELKSLAEGTYGTPFFSHDGRWLAYFGQEPSWRLRKIALSGGAPVTICSFEYQGGGTWAADDVIYFISATPGALMRVPAAGGEPVKALDIDFDQGERLYKFPWALPGGEVLFTVGTMDTESFDDAQIAVFSPRTGAKRILVEGGTSPCYSPSGHLVYARNGSLLAVSFDPDRLEVTGHSFTVLEGVLMSRNTGVANFDISATGDLVYVPGKAVGGARTLHWVDRRGRAEQLPLPPRSYLHPRLSPDITRLAIEVEGSDHDVYVYDFRNGILSNITTDGVSHWPVWSPDGKRIAYRSGPLGRFQLFQVSADRSGPAEQVAAMPDVSQSPGSYSPDGRALVYTMNLMTASAPRVAVVPLEGDRTPRPLDDTRYAQGSPKFSPDGRFLAYCSNESRRPQVYVQAFPGPGPKVQVSSDGGTDPVWRRDGGELFYRSGDSMMVVSVPPGAAFSAGRPQELWKGSYSHGMSSSCGAPGLTSSNYDVTADGRRFLMIRDDDIESETSREIVLVQGWADELRRLSTQT